MKSLPRPSSRVFFAAFLLLLILLACAQPRGGGLTIAGWQLPDLCPWAAVGKACPGCGTTRALAAFLHGRFALAWRTQPAALPFLAAALFALPWPGRGKAFLRGGRILCVAAGLLLAFAHFLGRI